MEVEEGVEQENGVQKPQLNSQAHMKEVDVKLSVSTSTSPKKLGPKQNPMEHLYYLDATKEGNVGRFINVGVCRCDYLLPFFNPPTHNL